MLRSLQMYPHLISAEIRKIFWGKKNYSDLKIYIMWISSEIWAFSSTFLIFLPIISHISNSSWNIKAQFYFMRKRSKKKFSSICMRTFTDKILKNNIIIMKLIYTHAFIHPFEHSFCCYLFLLFSYFAQHSLLILFCF